MRLVVFWRVKTPQKARTNCQLIVQSNGVFVAFRAKKNNVFAQHRDYFFLCLNESRKKSENEKFREHAIYVHTRKGTPAYVWMVVRLLDE